MCVCACVASAPGHWLARAVPRQGRFGATAVMRPGAVVLVGHAERICVLCVCFDAFSYYHNGLSVLPWCWKAVNVASCGAGVHFCVSRLSRNVCFFFFFLIGWVRWSGACCILVHVFFLHYGMTGTAVRQK